jgi:hypothetical protein
MKRMLFIFNPNKIELNNKCICYCLKLVITYLATRLVLAEVVSTEVVSTEAVATAGKGRNFLLREILLLHSNF